MGNNLRDFTAEEILDITKKIFIGKWVQDETGIRNEALIQKWLEALKKQGFELDIEDIVDITQENLATYNERIFFSCLSKQVADYVYPINISEYAADRDKSLKQSCANRILRETCESELKTKGMAIVKIKLPNINKKIGEEFCRTKKLL